MGMKGEPATKRARWGGNPGGLEDSSAEDKSNTTTAIIAAFEVKYKMKKYTKEHLDILCFDISCAIASVGAVHDAMENGDSAADSYLDALHGTYSHLYELKKELRRLVDALFEKDCEAAEKEAAR